MDDRLNEIRRVVQVPEVSQTIEQKVDEALRMLRTLTEQGRAGPVPSPTAVKEAREKPRVFIGSSTEGLQVAELIQLGLEEAAECTLWTQSTFAPGQTTIESIVDVSVQYGFAVIVLTADDLTVKRGVEAAAPRDNVLFELGLFTGALGRARTFMVYSRDDQVVSQFAKSASCSNDQT